MKKIMLWLLIMFIALSAVGCSTQRQIEQTPSPTDHQAECTSIPRKELLQEKLKASEIDKVQVVLPMGNPKYGAPSKNITDPKEIAELVEIMNTVTIGDEIGWRDIVVGGFNAIRFFSGGSLLSEFVFPNFGAKGQVVQGGQIYHVYFEGKTIDEIYKQSQAKIITVDLNFNEMVNPPMQ